MLRAVTLLLSIAALAPAMADEDAELRALVIDTNSGRLPATVIAPKYPRKARRDRVEGQVQVCFEVDRKGRPRRVTVRHSTNRMFERPSIRAVKASSFRPLADDQELPPIKSCRTFKFALQPLEDQQDLD